MLERSVPAADKPAASLRWSRAQAWALALVVLVAAVPRVQLALEEEGIYWPDELIKSVEQAHRLVYGYGYVPFEFEVGSVTWAFPAALAGVLLLLEQVGVVEPEGYLVGVRLAMVFLSLATGIAAYTLARAAGAHPLPALLAPVGFLFAAPAVYFSPRALTEVASTLPIVLGLALCSGGTRARRDVVLGMSLLGLATVLRLQNALFPLVIILAMLLRRDWAGARRASLTGLWWAFVLGLVDRLTWGRWFNSVIENVRFNLIEDGAAQFGEASALYYLQFLYDALGPAAVVLVVCSSMALRRAHDLWACFAVFLLFHSAVGHKEARFVFALLPLLAVLAALGVDSLLRRSPSRATRTCATGAAAALTAASVASLVAAPFLTFPELGHPGPQLSAYDFKGDAHRLLLVANDAVDLCGIKDELDVITFTGAYAYLHRDVPFYDMNGPDRTSGHYNYVITAEPGGADVVAQEGPLALLRLGSGCPSAPADLPAVE